MRRWLYKFFLCPKLKDMDKYISKVEKMRIVKEVVSDFTQDLWNFLKWLTKWILIIALIVLFIALFFKYPVFMAGITFAWFVVTVFMFTYEEKVRQYLVNKCEEKECDLSDILLKTQETEQNEK